MTSKQIEMFRGQLLKLAARLQGDTSALEEQTRMNIGGESSGNLSDTPLHLGDLGTEAYMQELDSILLENEEYLLDEVLGALERIEQGAFGRCERCEKPILKERLEALPYTRYCTPCSEAMQAGYPADLEVGRPHSGADMIDPYDDEPGPEPGDTSGLSDQIPIVDREDEPKEDDTHAAGTAGGGTAVGGLAGTNIGAGEPVNTNLEAATGSGNFDTEVEKVDEETTPYSGPSGGAVGGTPAGKRSAGGKSRHGVSPRPDPGDSSTGQ